MKIWIDLSNSPHVLFFAPIIEELKKRDHKIFVTHRDFAQTSELCRIYKIDSKCIGKHGGQGALKKCLNITKRALQLIGYGKRYEIDLAMSHNSYAHCLASKVLGINYITVMDYEYQPANHINFRLSDKVMVPFTFKHEDIKKYGAKNTALIKYPGIKEEVYLWGFEKDENFWKNNFPGFDTKKIICSIRPPATMAAYHNFENELYNVLIKFLQSNKDLQVLILPRKNDRIKKFARNNIHIITKAVDGRQLIANSDLIISAGGTMNREAAILGTPAYSIFAGKLGSVDNHLKNLGKLKIIKTVNDFKLIKLNKNNSKKNVVKRDVFDFFIYIISENKWPKR